MDFNALWDVSYGMYVIGARQEQKNYGCIVNTVFQVTSENPIVCLSMNKDNATHDAIVQSGRFSAAILSEKTAPRLIGTFGFYSSQTVDKYQGVAHEMVDGLPVVTDQITGYLICQIVSVVDVQTHSLILGRVMQARKLADLPPMTYDYYHKVIKGKAPKAAPTYVSPEKEKAAAQEKTVYICDICGYLYEGDFSQAPADYVCPVCKADRSHFQPHKAK